MHRPVERCPWLSQKPGLISVDWFFFWIPKYEIVPVKFIYLFWEGHKILRNNWDNKKSCPIIYFFRSWLHWMLVNVKGFQTESGRILCKYTPPTPSANSGLHRYIFFLFKQEDHLDQVGFLDLLTANIFESGPMPTPWRFLTTASKLEIRLKLSLGQLEIKFHSEEQVLVLCRCLW